MSTQSPFAVLRTWARLPSIPQSIQFSLFILGAHLASLLPTGLLEIGILQAITGFVLLSFLPGFLLMSHVVDEFRLTDILYAIGFSVAFSMFVGLVVNLFSLFPPVWFHPFEQPTMSLMYIVASGLLCGFVWTVNGSTSTLSIRGRSHGYDIRVFLIIACIPIFAVAGALLINRFNFNGLTLLTIGIIAITPVVVYYYDQKGRYYSTTIAAISAALLLQNTVITTYLKRGDAGAEYDIVETVLQNGFWIPGAAKDAMPRIGVLQSTYTLLMDTSLLWTFKLVHPILFVAVPVITYVIASRYFSKKIAFLSGILYIFLPRTYQIISRNTRTGAAIFFTAMLLLILLDDERTGTFRRFLVITFYFGVISSHYGVGPLVLFALGVAYVLNTLAVSVLNRKRSSRLRFVQVLIFTCLIIIWYAFLTNGTFEFIISAIYGQISDALFITGESTAVRAATVSESRGIFGMPPGSYEVMFLGHLLLGVFASVGIGLVYLRYFAHGLPYLQKIRKWTDSYVFAGLSDRVVEDSNYIHLAVGMFAFFPLSFGPQILSAGRTYALVMIIIAPLPILVLRSTRLARIGAKPALVSMMVFLLITSGFMAAAVTHDVSPQPIIDGERIVEDGSTLEQFAYYRSSNSENVIEASGFISTNLPQDAIVHKSLIGKFILRFHTSEPRSDIQFTRIDSSSEDPQGYTYFSEPDTVTGINTQRYAGFIFYEYEPLPSYPGSDLIYTSGQDKVHHHSRANESETSFNSLIDSQDTPV